MLKLSASFALISVVIVLVVSLLATATTPNTTLLGMGAMLSGVVGFVFILCGLGLVALNERKGGTSMMIASILHMPCTIMFAYFLLFVR